MHKTGSTSIQQSLDGYSDHRFTYARLGDNPNHSLPIYSLFASDPGSHRLHRKPPRSAFWLGAYIRRVAADLQRTTRTARGRTLIISGEDIGTLDAAGVFKMAEWCRANFDQVTIVGYVRPPAAFMTSAFQQRIKGGAARFHLQRMYRSYRDNFAKFDEAFGIENVCLWKFEPALFPNKDVVKDFCTRIQLPVSNRWQTRLNKSLPRQAVCALYTYNKFSPVLGFESAKPAELHGVGEALGALASGKFQLSADAVLPILEDNKEDIRWMEQRLGVSLDESVSAHADGDILEEADLLRPDPEFAAKLVDLLGRRASAGISGKTPKEMAILVHALRSSRTSRTSLFFSWITGHLRA
jgi:hypothetical protein